MEIIFDDTTFTAQFADLLRPMTSEERAYLTESVREDGIKTPILIDETNGLIDGINRLSIAVELDLHPIEVPFKVMAGLSPDEKRRIALSLNTARRHLTGEEIHQARTNADKWTAVEAALEAHPEKSDTTIAKEVGVSQPFVGKVRETTSHNRYEMPETRTVTRGGQTYTQNVANIGKKAAPVPTSEDPPLLPEPAEQTPVQQEWDRAIEWADSLAEGDEQGDTEANQQDDDQGDDLIDGSKFTYSVSLGAWVPRETVPEPAIETPEVGPSEEVRQTREERTAQREAARLQDLERRAAESVNVTTPATWEIRLADCVEGLDAFVEKEREGCTVRLAFCDPPYNIGWDYGEGRQEDDLDHDEYVKWCEDWIHLVMYSLTPDGSFWLLIGDEFAAELKITAESAGFHLRQWLIWYEAFGVNCQSKFNRCHRHLLHFTVDPEEFVFNADAPEVRRPSDRQEKYGDPRAAEGGKLWDSVWGINPAIPRVCGTHAEAIPGSPAPQLPLALLRPIIACASEPGDLILDPFCGNATTGVAALQAGRRFLGFEKREPIHHLATLRMRATVADLARKGN